MRVACDSRENVLLVTSLAVCLGPVASGSPFSSLTAPIRQEIESVERELESLPLSPINPSPWTLGYSSAKDKGPDGPVRIDIRFPEVAEIDLVALMPATFNDDRDEIRAFGFPRRFVIERLLPDGSTRPLADHRDADYPVPGIEPQIFACPDPVDTAGLRITATALASNPTWWQADEILAFSELFAFAGDRNVALDSEVRASSAFKFSYVWSPECLTDGFSLFSPIDYDLTDPMDTFTAGGEGVVLGLDLGSARRIDEFRLWPVVHSIQHNYPAASGVGFPAAIRLEIADNEDFSDAVVVYQTSRPLAMPGSGPFMHRTVPASGRFVRLTMAQGMPDFRRPAFQQIALSEFELLEEGRVVSGNAETRVIESSRKVNRLSCLTDGRSVEGVILPLREWVIRFQRRIELERRLAALRLDLDRAQLKEEKRTRLLLIAAFVTVVGLIQLVWLVRAGARRRWSRMRERIACDLHDELGANVSSIAHTAELLGETIPEPTETQTRLLGNLLDGARRTSRDARHLVYFVKAEDDARNLSEQLRKVAEQILGTIPVRFDLAEGRGFNRLDPATKWNFLLFFKEALNNIIKHAAASAVEITTGADGSTLRLVVADNGCGLPSEAPPIRHLESRAATLGGELHIYSGPEGGTRVSLSFQRKSSR